MKLQNIARKIRDEDSAPLMKHNPYMTDKSVSKMCCSVATQAICQDLWGKKKN